MALIIGGRYVYKYFVERKPADSSEFYISVESDYLSQAYDLVDGDRVTGEITVIAGVKDKSFPALKGQQLTLILKKEVAYDYLFIQKDDWNRLFREWGLVKAGYVVALKLKEVIRTSTKEKIALYAKTDVEV